MPNEILESRSNFSDIGPIINADAMEKTIAVISGSNPINKPISAPANAE